MIKNYFQTKLTIKYLYSVLNSQKALNSLMFQLAEVEEGESGGGENLFDKAINYVKDPALKKMIEIHKLDEERHAKELKSLIRGDYYYDLEDRKDLSYLYLIEKRFFESLTNIRNDIDLLKFFSILKVLEERAIENYQLYLRTGFKKKDFIYLFQNIIKDEKKHLRFCDKVISSISSVNLSKKERIYLSYKEMEEEIFYQITIGMMQFHVDKNIFPNKSERLFWQLIKFSLSQGNFKKYSNIA
ncbi:hypothetical protein N9N67_09145 [Bacteriovoracaceae bacterium]|nr:hypothetical protein [Bacteriovoracaceae bacterium]